MLRATKERESHLPVKVQHCFRDVLYVADAADTFAYGTLHDGAKMKHGMCVTVGAVQTENRTVNP